MGPCTHKDGHPCPCCVPFCPLSGPVSMGAQASSTAANFPSYPELRVGSVFQRVFFFLFSLCSEGREVSSRNTQAFPTAPCPRRLSYIRFSQPRLAIGGQAVVDRSPQQGPSQALVVVWREPLCSWCSHWSLRSCGQP